jgi:hypothetical protein
MKITTLLAVLSVLLAFFGITEASAHSSNYNKHSIVDVMNKKGMDSSIKGRIAVAKKFNVPYIRSSHKKPTEKMNIALLAAIQQSGPIMDKDSVVDWLKFKEKKESSVGARIVLAENFNIPYVAKASTYPTAEMNIRLLQKLKSNGPSVERLHAALPEKNNVVENEIATKPSETASRPITVVPVPEIVQTPAPSVTVLNPTVLIVMVPIFIHSNPVENKTVPTYVEHTANPTSAPFLPTIVPKSSTSIFVQYWIWIPVLLLLGLVIILCTIFFRRRALRRRLRLYHYSGNSDEED